MDKHTILKKYISGIVKGYVNSLIVCSPAGYGKTEALFTSLQELNLEEEKHFMYITNFITPLELYLLMEKINNLKEPKLLIFDDCEAILENSAITGLLRSALWETPLGKRKVCWVSGTHKIQNKSFNFNGRIIFLINQLKKKNPIINALKDRGFYYEMKLTLDDMIKLMEERAENQEYQNIPYNKRKEIVRFLKDNSKDDSKISLRSLSKTYNLYLLSPNHWKTLAFNLLNGRDT